MKQKLRKRILTANIEEHKKEAKYYDLLHLELYNKYEQKRLKKGIETVVKKIKSSNIEVLDVGSGTGNLIKLLLSLNLNKTIKVTAVDISKEMQKEMQNKLKAKNINYHTNDIDSFLHTNKTKFDIVMISSVLHHLPDYVGTLNSLLKHMKKDGIIYATHEPLNYKERSNNLFYRTSNFVDKNMYSVRFILFRLFGKLPGLKMNYSDADYHTKEGGLSPEFIKNKINCSKIEIKKYSVNYYTSGLSNRLHHYNCFEMIIYA